MRDNGKKIQVLGNEAHVSAGSKILSLEIWSHVVSIHTSPPRIRHLACTFNELCFAMRIAAHLLHFPLPLPPGRVGTGLKAKILCAACSEAITIIADGLPVVMPGKMDASTTKRLSVPYTFVFRSTTELPPVRPSSLPSLAVPIQWFALRLEGETIIYRDVSVSFTSGPERKITHVVDKGLDGRVRGRQDPGDVRDDIQRSL